MSRFSRRLRQTEPVEMNITAFMNLMVILVPFLLITAVFSRITILELNLPAATAGKQQTRPPALQLEIVVRRNTLEVADRGARPIVIKNRTDGYDLVALSRLLQKIKQRFPRQDDATILLEPDIDYETLVQVMDTVRTVTVKQAGANVQAALFPAVSIGDAPSRQVRI